MDVGSHDTFAFVARTEDGSRTMKIYGEREQIDAGTLADPAAKISGMVRLETESGTPVNRLGKGRYEVVGEGIILVSDDPDAP